MHFATNSALARGDGGTALAVAGQFRAAYGAKPFNLLGSAPFFAAGLHAPVADVMALPEDKSLLANVFRHYARGEAMARSGDAAGVEREAQAIGAILDGPQSATLGSKTAESLVKVSRHVLEGRAAMLAKDPAKAADAYFLGLKAQAAANFSFDPPLFWYPVRRSYGAALVAAGDYQRAREHLLVTLVRWPNDPLTLYTLSMAERGLGDEESADRNLARAKAVWKGDISKIGLARI